MKRIEGYTGTAPKMTVGNLEYCLWIDCHGAVYFQITKNDTETKIPGSHSSLAFRLSDYINHSDMTNISGINLSTFKTEISKDKDMPAFIKAVSNHLLP